MVTDARKMTRKQVRGEEEGGAWMKENKGARGGQEEEGKEMDEEEGEEGRGGEKGSGGGWRGPQVTGTFCRPGACKVLDSNYLTESPQKPNAGGNITTPISQMWKTSSGRRPTQGHTARGSGSEESPGLCDTRNYFYCYGTYSVV